MTAHPGLSSVHSIWNDVKVGDLVKGQQAVIVDAELPVEAAAEILVKNGISSAPVFNKQTNTYTGMFDYQDLVSYILIVFKKKVWKEEEENVEIKEIIRRALHSEPVAVKLVSDLSQRDPFYSVTPETSLLQAMDVFSKGIHRLCVVDAAGKVIGVLTQSNVSNYLYSKINMLTTAQRTIKDLGLSNSKVISINAEAQVFDAMNTMRENGVTSLPMVDHGGHLVGSISLSDIKYVLKGFKYNMLWRTCFQFISYVRNHQGLVEDAGRDRYPVFDVREGDSLVRALGKMGATKSHRVWVVNETVS
jgi:CBS domain-containing protein